MLLDRTINYGLFYACHYLNSGKKLAREILNENIERSQIKVGIPVKLGFHSRPSLLVAKIVQHFGGQVELVVGEGPVRCQQCPGYPMGRRKDSKRKVFPRCL
jgi:hypothetical protein